MSDFDDLRGKSIPFVLQEKEPPSLLTKLRQWWDSYNGTVINQRDFEQVSQALIRSNFKLNMVKSLYTSEVSDTNHFILMMGLKPEDYRSTTGNLLSAKLKADILRKGRES